MLMVVRSQEDEQIKVFSTSQLCWCRMFCCERLNSNAMLTHTHLRKEKVLLDCMLDLYYSNSAKHKMNKVSRRRGGRRAELRAQIEINGFSNWSTCLSKWRSAADIEPHPLTCTTNTPPPPTGRMLGTSDSSYCAARRGGSHGEDLLTRV